MDNASKALLMAAGVLIGLMILSLAVFLFANFGAASAEAHRQNEANQINKFNSQFTKYQGRTDITIHDIVTAANLAKSNNETYGLTTSEPSNLYITVNAKTTKGTQNNLEKEETSYLNELVQYELQHLKTEVDSEETDENGQPIEYATLPKYSCKVEISTITERVFLVKFELIND